MSLTTILNKGVTGLTAQSAALNTISDNIANSTTTGYKASETEFSALVAKGASFDGPACAPTPGFWPTKAARSAKPG